MQFCGFEENQLVLASEASRGKNYLCPECGSAMRVRGGPHRQIHFYHLQRPQKCKLHQKTLPHLQTQLRIQNLIPPGQAQMEYPISSISRIADVAWIERKIVFEVQCSPISYEEAKGRTEDYAKAGWRLVWILHERRFNQKNISPAEHFLRQRLCYFTTIDEKGAGIIYDQFDQIAGMRRIAKTPPLPVALEIPLDAPFRFRGDRLDRGNQNPLSRRKEKRDRTLWQNVKRFYNTLLSFALEKVSR